MNIKSALITSGGSSNAFDVFGQELTHASSVNGIDPYGLCGGVAGLKKGTHTFADLRDHDWRSAIRTGEPFPEFSRAADVVLDEDLPDLSRKLAAEGFGLVIVAGGDGSLKMYSKWLPSLRESGIRSSFIPGTIDGDIYPWKRQSLGTSSAEDGAIRTARSFLTNHLSDAGARMFLVDCMGRRNGTIALSATQGAGMFAFLLPEETERVPHYAVKIRKELEIENPETMTAKDLVTYLALSHLKIHYTARSQRQQRFTFILGEGVGWQLKITTEQLGEEITSLLRSWGVSKDVHYKVTPEKLGYLAVRIVPSNSVDCALASEYAWGVVEAFVQRPELQDVLVVPDNNGSFEVKTHEQVFSTAVPSATTKLDLKTNRIYRRVARARGERMLFSYDLDDPSALARMYALTPDLAREEFDKMVRTVAWIGDTKDT
jgi:6-phosphofructokinase